MAPCPNHRHLLYYREINYQKHVHVKQYCYTYFPFKMILELLLNMKIKDKNNMRGTIYRISIYLRLEI